MTKAEKIAGTYHRPLLQYEGQKPPAPDWFKRSIEIPSHEAEVDVHGAKIRYSAWGDGPKRGLLFVHGGRAHRNWWRPFAPFFCHDRRVAALDISGMGDSDWRDQYSLEMTVHECLAVIEAAGLAEHARPIIIGHSFGGWVTLATVERAGDQLGGAVIIDSPLTAPDPDEGYTIVSEREEKNQGIDETPFQMKSYRTPEEPISRFRFLPDQPGENHYLLDYIAREGIVSDTIDGEARWRWKFDPFKGGNFEVHFERELLRAARCPLAFIYGEESVYATGETISHLKHQARGRSPFMVMPNAHHHLMMDQPIAFVSALRTLLSCWPVRFGV